MIFITAMFQVRPANRPRLRLIPARPGPPPSTNRQGGSIGPVLSARLAINTLVWENGPGVGDMHRGGPRGAIFSRLAALPET
jgi:hypothetical protein